MKNATFKIIQLHASEMDNFSYLIYCPKTLRGAAVDPSMRPELLLDAIKKHAIQLEFLLNTHGHADHISGNKLILDHTGAKLAAHPADMPTADILLAEGSEIVLGEGTIEVMHTPGHTPGSVVFKTDQQIITGDTLFVSRCGRADLPGSDVVALYQSLQRLKKLPEETRIYPGHNYGPTPTSTIGWELKNNEYLKCPDLQSFTTLRLGG
ncbi:Glyoxylase, beta-lactamase superfamily II [Desulfuromusa kysingii]|uniref:Glyoxylase, beta-lactamase superfamily II n=1 Tax=Desulfuromusa kysingii TaxID=37625 RepID=A0A1H3XLE2_9BACT|nr:hydroxyacylglutathione hydrolase family protein [Desulfuromusa kysingii]SDZ99761.1 Glyoxylase, beta-lactamase superfamily II [Desulfuromusa kysingii]